MAMDFFVKKISSVKIQLLYLPNKKMVVFLYEL